jgi:DNA-binding XRE family transcriptional regulator
MKTLRDRMNELDPARRRRVDARAAEIFAEEMSIKDLRKAQKITQARLAKSLNITQDGVSRIEKRTDLLLSTLRKSIEAMGGHLRLVAQFHGRAPVVLTGFQGAAALQNRRARKRRPTSHHKPATSSREPG